MKNIVWILLIMFSALNANEAKPTLMPTKEVKTEKVVWLKDLNIALEQAQKEKKPIILVVSKRSCKWCYHYKTNTLLNPMVVKAINRDFIAVMVEMEDGTLPKAFWTPGTPATWFIDNQPQPMFQPLMGSQPADQLLAAFTVVTTEFKK